MRRTSWCSKLSESLNANQAMQQSGCFLQIHLFYIAKLYGSTCSDVRIPGSLAVRLLLAPTANSDPDFAAGSAQSDQSETLDLTCWPLENGRVQFAMGLPAGEESDFGNFRLPAVKILNR